MTGQDLTTTAIATLENFLADNQKFNDFDDIIRFITETLSEENQDSILQYVDEPKTVLEVLDYLVSKTISLTPEMENKLEQFLRKLKVEEITRLYYKNKVLEFIFSNSYPKKCLKELLKYEYFEEPQKEMIDSLDQFKKMIMDSCFSDILFEDRYKRTMKNTRKSVIGSDTDSVFITFNNYIQHVTREYKLNPENESEQMTVINIFISVVRDGIGKISNKLSNNMGLLKEYFPNINMKSEYLFKRMLLTRNKKSYASIITAELGRVLESPELEIKGLSIKKTTISKNLRKKFTSILENDILKSKEINLKSIIDQFDNLGLVIEESLKNGEVSYSLPKNLEVIEGYKDPSALEQVRGVIIWNALEPDSQIVPPEKINLLKLVTIEKDHPELKKLQLNYPDKYKVIMDVVFNEGITNSKSNKMDISRFGLSTIAIPKFIECIPEYIRPLIDFKTMINKNITNGLILLESLGIFIEEVKTNKYKSNIIGI